VVKSIIQTRSEKRKEIMDDEAKAFMRSHMGRSPTSSS
jgi:hypothetical protein